MGSTFAKGKGNTNATTATSEPTSAELPYIWAIRDPTILDWRNDKYNPADPEGEAAFNKQRRSDQHNQANLPVPIGEPTTGLFLGDAKCARNIERLNELGINCIINVASEASKNYDLDTDYLKSGINILRLSAEDEEGFPMLELHLKTVMDQLNKWKAVTDTQRNCLVHCTAGINRSGVLVAALLMEQEQMTVLDVVRHVRSRRGNAFLWNESFQEQLVAHASKIGLLGAPHPDTPDVFPTGMFGTADEKAAVKRKKDVKKLF